MSDPLSVTLAAITLATTLKDIVILAQKLNDSFKKPARNLRNAQSLAAETLETVQDLKNFYDGHKKILDNTSEMQNAMQKLSNKMETVHSECQPILQVYITSNGKIGTWIKYKFGTWRKRNKLEECIRKLRDDANKCRLDFMMFAVLRIEATAVHIRGDLADGLARAHGPPSALRVSDAEVLSFLGSHPGILANLPPRVILPERLVYTSYIGLRVGKIDTLFKDLASRRSYPIEKPDSFHLSPFRYVVWLNPSTKEEIEDVRSQVFAHIAKIEESLKGGLEKGMSIQRGARELSALSAFLCNLGMFREYLTITQFVVDLYRTLNQTHGDVYGPYLAHALCKMSDGLYKTGERVTAYKVITEAVTLARRHGC